MKDKKEVLQEIFDNDPYNLLDISHDKDNEMTTKKENLNQLPYSCYGVLLSENIVISIQKGDNGYTPLHQLKPDEKYKTVEDIANALNEAKGITKAQRSAMEWGSQFGWDHGLSDVNRYNKNGNIINKH